MNLSNTGIARGLVVLLALIGLGASAPKPEPGEESISIVLAAGIERPPVGPPRGIESRGPFPKLAIKNIHVIDGTGAPTRGPVSVLVENDRIVEIRDPNPLDPHTWEFEEGTEILDGTGKYAIPGLIDAHAHLGSPFHAFGGALTDPAYVNKLWLAHGVTTVREVGAIMGLEWTLEHKERSEAGELAAPRMVVFALFPERFPSPAAARAWVRAVRKKGADGVKFLGAAPELIAAAIDEARQLGMQTAQHHSQVSVTRLNVLDTARMGLTSMEHWYGLPEALFEDRIVQDYPADYNYANEQDRFGEAGKLWLQAAAPGSERWNAVIDELVALDFTIDPTFTIYEANRDLMRAQHAPWHSEYTMPYILRSFEADPHVHGSHFLDWTTSHEVAWKTNYQRWMTFVSDYKNRGGRITVGSDSGFIWKIYGFGYVRELEMLQEAGFHPLEVMKSATINGAELLGMDTDIGSIEVGKKADLVIVNENPLRNFKVLYGTGHRMLDRESGEMVTSTGIETTIKDGILFDAKQLLADVRKLVADQKAKEAQAAAQSH